MSIGSVYEAAYKGDFNQVKVQTDANNKLIETPDSNNRLLIHWAALGGNENLVEYLIDIGSPVDPADDTNSTPLILAASAGRYEVVRLLVGKGANVNHKKTRNYSALQYASSKGYKEIVKFLIDADADVNIADALGATPLHRAASQGRTDIVEILLSSPQILVDTCDFGRCTALHLACVEDREATARMLIKAGAKVELKNRDKMTALDLCSSRLKEVLSNIIE